MTQVATIALTPDVLAALKAANINVDVQVAEPHPADEDQKFHLEMFDIGLDRMERVAGFAEDMAGQACRAAEALRNYADRTVEARQFFLSGDVETATSIMEGLNDHVCALIGTTNAHYLDWLNEEDDEDRSHMLLGRAVLGLGDISSDVLKEVLDAVPAAEPVEQPEPAVQPVDDCTCGLCGPTPIGFVVVRRAS
ncbi:hypothetical protein [Paracoccus litorisediminis]|uniref:Uncharacterized protein n=1 Tax=Paracoccus litorisediminis TaxID=2006130 RepID=A0A844HUD5_9RHOB|nr:hypothetical protein [Paracoccus litorisediminis]MTH61122.1 hypothetical protein [Paracoccus litorisediminis]